MTFAHILYVLNHTSVSHAQYQAQISKTISIRVHIFAKQDTRFQMLYIPIATCGLIRIFFKVDSRCRILRTASWRNSNPPNRPERSGSISSVPHRRSCKYIYTNIPAIYTLNKFRTIRACAVNVFPLRVAVRLCGGCGCETTQCPRRAAYETPSRTAHEAHIHTNNTHMNPSERRTCGVRDTFDASQHLFNVHPRCVLLLWQIIQPTRERTRTRYGNTCRRIIKVAFASIFKYG